ncbi:NUDIX hydrolase [Roseateles sp.]|uniref:NUDIX hydrolase n=1 Tax=Roseateles sp. TaxID=1971397 RepID=UPI0039EC674F
MSTHKAVAVLLRGEGSDVEVLVFRHPLAGVQLVKGSVEAGESVRDAAVRELAEESGLHTVHERSLGSWPSRYQGQVWHFEVVTATTPVRDAWAHLTQDDGGHVFRFFWHRLHAPAGEDWHPVYRDALAELRQRLAR